MSHSLKSETVSSFYYYGNNTEIAANGQLKHPELILIGDRVTIKEDYSIQPEAPASLPLPKIIIGDDCKCEQGLTLYAINRIEIKSNVTIGSNVSISDARQEYRQIGIPVMAQGWMDSAGEVIIGEGTQIGEGTVIAGNIRIGKHSVIYPGSVIEQDLPDYCVAGGSPHRFSSINQLYPLSHRMLLRFSPFVFQPITVQPTLIYAFPPYSANYRTIAGLKSLSVTMPLQTPPLR